MKTFIEQHDAVQEHTEVLLKLVTILNYPDSLAHELRKGWPEIQFLMRGLHHYFTVIMPEHHRAEDEVLFPWLRSRVSEDEVELIDALSEEHTAIESVAELMVEVSAAWTTSTRLPAKSDIARFSGLAGELVLHVERHQKIEDERLFPLVQRRLNDVERAQLEKLVHEIDERPRKAS